MREGLCVGGWPQRTIADDVPVLSEMEDLPKPIKLLATYTDAEWKPPRSATMRATEDGAETGSSG